MRDKEAICKGRRFWRKNRTREPQTREHGIIHHSATSRGPKHVWRLRWICRCATLSLKGHAARLADEGLNNMKWGGRGGGITAAGIITYQMDQISQSTYLQLYLLLRALQDVRLTGFVSRNCSDVEEKFLAACRENIRWRQERSLVTIMSELSPCYWANHKLPVGLFNPYSLPSHMRNKKEIMIETIRQMAVGGPLAGSRWNTGMTSVI